MPPKSFAAGDFLTFSNPRTEALSGSRGGLLRAKMPELDSLRGIACLMVLFFHGFANRYIPEHLNGVERIFVGMCRYGFTGVNLFFVLSGFLITGILLETRHKTDYYRRFYIRRALRILPLYYGILLLLIVVWRAGLTDRPFSWAFLGFSAIYLANTTPLFDVPIQFGVLWSLAVEEHFYLLWPALVQRLRTKALVILAFVLCVAALGFRFTAFHFGSDVFGFYTWMVCDGLSMGALLAIAIRHFHQSRRVMLRIATLAFAYAVLCAVVERFATARYTGAALQISGSNAFYGATLIAALLLGSRYGIRSRVLEFFGEISYGLYLVHMLVFDIFDALARRHFPVLAPGHLTFPLASVRFGIVAAVAVGSAWLSRWYFEEPFLRLKDRFASDHHSARDREMEPIPGEAAA